MVHYDLEGSGCMRGDDAQLAFEIATLIVLYTSRVLGYDVVNHPETAISNKYIDKAVSMILSDRESLEGLLGKSYEVQGVDKLAEVLRSIS